MPLWKLTAEVYQLKENLYCGTRYAQDHDPKNYSCLQACNEIELSLVGAGDILAVANETGLCFYQTVHEQLPQR